MSWDKSPTLFADLLTQDTVKHTQRIARDMLKGLVAKAPVDTSAFVGNMNLSYDVPDYTFDKNKIIGRAGALRNGMTFINAMPLNQIKTVVIANATPYGKYLESGYSNQAPNGVFYPVFLGIATWYR